MRLFHFPLVRSPILVCIGLTMCASVWGEGGSHSPTPSKADEVHRTYLETLRKEGRFPTAASCSQCHPDHFEEWSVSPHAYAMMSPVFNSMHTFITQRTGGTNGDFCIRCHTPVAMEREEDLFGSVLLRSPAVQEGVSCIVCHRVSEDYGTSSGRFSIHQGPLSDPVFGPQGGEILKSAIDSGDYGLVTSEEERGKLVHKEALHSPVISRSAQCGTCHDVNSPTGIRLESAFTEFKNSPASAHGDSCQDCHMNQTPGRILPDEERHTGDGHDKNYAYGPAARVKNSPRDHGEGIATPSRKRTNHMFIGPDYSIVHPGLFPHNVEAAELTYTAWFKKVVSEEAGELIDYMRSSKEEQDAAKNERLRKASRVAAKNARPDWLSFRWEDGWGTDAFEEELSETERKRRLAGAPFPWVDADDPMAAMYRRKAARLILSKQFNLLNRAHAERTRILRRGLQLGEFTITRDDNRSLAFELDVHNPMNGHAVPTGFDAERIMFLEVTIRDIQDRVLFQSGDRDPNGDLRDLHSAYVHASAPKEGEWLAVSDWKKTLGIKQTKEDLYWRPDPFLFSLQSKFVGRNLAGGESEHSVAVNTSLDPIPFVRPPTSAQVHTGRGGGFRKQFRTIPPLSHRTAKYSLNTSQLSGERPYRIDIRLIAQMVPVSLVKKISSVGFDMNLSPAEVARRVTSGHKINQGGERRGGAVTIWDKSVILDRPSSGTSLDFTPTEEEILKVSVADYPFPHTSEEELKASEAMFSGSTEVEDYMIQTLGPLLPELWPGGVPTGLSLFPDSSAPTKPTTETSGP